MTLPAALLDDAPHLLVVDDDRRIRDLLSRFLAGEGYRVTTAETAADARAKLKGLSFDLLILDVMMPGESGFDLAKAIRGDSTVPILMLTTLFRSRSSRVNCRCVSPIFSNVRNPRHHHRSNRFALGRLSIISPVAN